MSPDEEGSTFTGLIQELLDSIRADDLDEEMTLRAEIKTEYKLTPEQITSALFKRLSNGKLKKNPIVQDSVDLSKVKPLCYLMDGWLLEGDISLLYAVAGTGKTTLALFIAYNFAKGINVLDRSKPCKAGNALFIATDGGANTFKSAMDDLGIADDDPIFYGDNPKIHLWAYESEQGHEAWSADINGVVKLEEFIKSKGIDVVWIDSAKSVASRGGWKYTDNDSVRVLLSYMREIIAQPNKCHIGFISHDGTEKGSHSGAKSWAEEPSMVVRLDHAKDEDGRKVGVEAKFLKDRAAHVDPWRTVRFNLLKGEGKMELLTGGIIVGSCEEGLIQILFNAYNLGTKSLSRKDICNQAYKLTKSSFKTVDNTLGALVNRRVLKREKRGHYALAPAQLQHLISLKSTGGKESKPIDITSVVKVPDTIPEGKEVLPEGKEVGNYQTPLFATGLD